LRFQFGFVRFAVFLLDWFGFCCESDSKLEKLKFAEAVKIGARFGEIEARFSRAELTLSFVKNWSTIWQNRSTISLRFRKIKHIFGPDLLQFYEGYFYYKYRHCISVNLEIEGAETRVQKGNNKTRVCIEFVSLEQTLRFEG